MRLLECTYVQQVIGALQMHDADNDLAHFSGISEHLKAHLFLAVHSFPDFLYACEMSRVIIGHYNRFCYSKCSGIATKLGIVGKFVWSGIL